MRTTESNNTILVSSFKYQKGQFQVSCSDIWSKKWNHAAEETSTKILKSFWISRLRENIVEDAVARGNEEKEPDEEADQEDTENSTEGITKRNDDEDQAIDKYLLLVWTCEFL